MATKISAKHLSIHMSKLQTDPIAVKWFEEIKSMDYEYISSKLRDKASLIWSMKFASEYFFDEMDFFDGKDTTLQTHVEKFCKRIQLVALAHYCVVKNHIIHIRYVKNLEPECITLWKKMLLDINKTTIWFENYYGIRIRCAGDSDSVSVNLKHNIGAFNEGYMKNILDLARKQLEVTVEMKRIECRMVVSELQEVNLIHSLKEESKRLTGQLDEHVVQYKKMKTAFDESQLANKALVQKVEAQDLLIKDLNRKMDAIIGLFGWFKEEIPKEMLRGLTDRCSVVSITDTEPSKTVNITDTEPSKTVG